YHDAGTTQRPGGLGAVAAPVARPGRDGRAARRSPSGGGDGSQPDRSAGAGGGRPAGGLVRARLAGGERLPAGVPGRRTAAVVQRTAVAGPGGRAGGEPPQCGTPQPRVLGAGGSAG